MPACYVIVALSHEAKPLLAHYHLKKDHASTVFPVFRNEKRDIHLIVTGIGKIAMAAGLSYLRLPKQGCCLNVGIAGSQAFALGQLVIANKIVDHALGRIFYPNIALLKRATFAEIHSHDFVQYEYPQQAVVDMEASAFFQTAALFVHQDLIHCAKIISDTHPAELRAITASRVTQLVAEQLDKIDDLINELQQLALPEIAPPLIFSFQQRWHFSVYQQHQLKKMLQRWARVIGSKDPLLVCASARHAQEVLYILKQQLENASYRWDE